MRLLAIGLLAALCAATWRPAPARACSVTATFLPPIWLRAKKRIADSPDDDRWIALYVLARSPRKDADAAARKVIKSGGDDLTSLIQGYGEARHSNADARLQAIAAHRLTAEQRKWLDRAIADRAGK